MKKRQASVWHRSAWQWITSNSPFNRPLLFNEWILVFWIILQTTYRFSTPQGKLLISFFGLYVLLFIPNNLIWSNWWVYWCLSSIPKVATGLMYMLLTMRMLDLEENDWINWVSLHYVFMCLWWEQLTTIGFNHLDAWILFGRTMRLL